MDGLMQSWPLTVDKILDHAARAHGGREVVTRSLEGPIVRTTYGKIHDRAKRLSSALLGFGVRPGDRVATLAWNSARHMEAWYAIMGIGAVCHTLNPRLFPDQLCWIMNHAEDRVLFTDATFLPILIERREKLPKLERIIVFGDAEQAAKSGLKGALSSEALIGGHAADAPWGGFGEETACGLCYTSGTTGNPKGVLYSHRSNFLHTLTALQTDVMGLSVRDTVLAVVPMFHANAWGLAFACPAVGAKLVMPGQKMDGASILELLESEEVNISAAVPTVWQMLLAHLRATGERPSHLERVLIGGSAVPEALIRAFHDDYGVEVIHAWGMTETSPLGTLGTLTPEVASLPFADQIPYRVKQGRAPLGIELKLTDDEGLPRPHDGESFGRLKVRGPFVARRYFKDEGG
ncbi:MAG: AMP-binding protein, partial [Caulobacteraceae bacterium]